MNSPFQQPGIRRIDPDAEAARLAGERKAASRQWFVVFGEIHQHGDEAIQVQVSATKPVRLPEGIGAKLAAVVAENWPAADE